METGLGNGKRAARPVEVPAEFELLVFPEGAGTSEEPVLVPETMGAAIVDDTMP
jgi:hypothetical protein